MNTARKGRSREYRSRRLLEAAGYEVIRSAASKGTWDLVGLSSSDVVLVQVKCNTMPAPAEREAMKGAKCPPNGRKLVHLYKDGNYLPAVFDITEEGE